MLFFVMAPRLENRFDTNSPNGEQMFDKGRRFATGARV